MASSSSSEKNEAKDTETSSLITSKCACGKVNIQIQLPTSFPETAKENGGGGVAVDCHCPKCRKYHVAAFASYLNVPSNQVNFLGDSSQHLQSYNETCTEVGPVQRLFCRHCFTKVATKPIAVPTDKEREEEKKKVPNNNNILINMGGLVDQTIPVPYRNAWSKEGGRIPWQQPSKACWASARPFIRGRGGRREPTNMKESLLLTSSSGSCACGKCQYRLHHVPYEMQHCYCKLCRQLSGAAYQTWVPADNRDFEWLTTPAPGLVRTTPHGQRHVCINCGSVLTIVYDEQPDTTWPAAGGLNDDGLPPTQEEMEPYLHRVCHICCKWKQSWYALPRDGLERIKYAC